MQPLRYLARRSLAGIVVSVITATIIGCTSQSNSPPTAQDSPQAPPPPATQPVQETPTSQQAETQTGSAAFISGELQGQKTASGETYDENQLVAAHASYPMGTVVRVTNPENNQTVEVRIIDRIAPAQSSDQPIIDLSRSAAQQLGFTQEGITKVRTEVVTLGKESPKQ